ncbi:FIG149030: hypothetical protein [hydrothermal vent metagenome]|uniref:DUF3375 domain-containing protein n=1 Tax=hydrothermal vent metagenome TaxID=652676 RepID=A0A1W1BLK8_9ZZZZ
MTYDYLENLKKNHLAIQVLNANHFSMIIGFFYHAFKVQKSQALKETEILNLLDDYLYALNEGYTEAKYPKSAKAYLDDFTHQDSNYLRKYYAYESDEPVYELMPDIEKLLSWLAGLKKQEFVATESKLKIIMTLLKELEFETNLSDIERIERLKKEKEAIDKQIEAIEKKEDLRFDKRKIKEQFMQIQSTSTELLSDFREIEHNFRSLNQEAKKAIASTQQGKSQVLEKIFEIEEGIRQSNQGESFYAFWDFLMDTEQIDKLNTLLENLYDLEDIQALDPQRHLENLPYHLLNGGENAHKVLAKLVEQLRRFIDDQVWVENRRILELAYEIEQKAMYFKDNAPTMREFFFIAGVKISVESLASKSLFRPSAKEEFSHGLKEKVIEVDLTKLYTQVYVDEVLLKQNIQKYLQKKPQFTLKELHENYPIQKGISELIVYLKLAQNMENSYLEPYKEEILIETAEAEIKKVVMDRVVFVRE